MMRYDSDAPIDKRVIGKFARDIKAKHIDAPDENAYVLIPLGLS
jgi:hypothetical protein